jgi:hypothetical protein
MDVMKRLLVLLGCSSALVCAADLAGVQNVYIMPMSRGLDQYLASRIASQGVFQVVTDPKRADAVFSDRVGEVLAKQLETIFPTPKSPEEIEAEQAAAAALAEKGETEEKDTSIAAAMHETANKLDSPAANSSFGRSKGNIFLVEAKSRLVLWSTYEPPKSNAARDLDRSANDIVSRLKKDLTPKKPK